MKLSSCCTIVKNTRVGDAIRLRCKWRLRINAAARGHSAKKRIVKFPQSQRREAPIPSHKAHVRLRGLSKQRFQRAFMPQCGRLRSMGVCGLEPTDSPPQRIEEEMKGAPCRPRPEGGILRDARPAARLTETFGTGFLPRSFGLAAALLPLSRRLCTPAPLHYGTRFHPAAPICPPARFCTFVRCMTPSPRSRWPGTIHVARARRRSNGPCLLHLRSTKSRPCL